MVQAIMLFWIMMLSLPIGMSGMSTLKLIRHLSLPLSPSIYLLMVATEIFLSCYYWQLEAIPVAQSGHTVRPAPTRWNIHTRIPRRFALSPRTVSKAWRNTRIGRSGFPPLGCTTWVCKAVPGYWRHWCHWSALLFLRTKSKLSTYRTFCIGASHNTMYCRRLSKRSLMSQSRSGRRSLGHHSPTE